MPQPSDQPKNFTVAEMLRASFIDRAVALDEKVRAGQTGWHLVDGVICNGVVQAEAVLFPHPYSEGVQANGEFNRAALRRGFSSCSLGEMASLHCVCFDGPTTCIKQIGRAHV